MKRRKSLIAIIAAAIVTFSAAVFLTVSTIIPAIASVINVKEDDFFIAEINSHHYKCYKLTDEGGSPIGGVAIAWNEEPSNATGTITIPDSVSYSGANYTIRGIAKGGFRYCQFTHINLPTTIEFIRPEAFAYCEKLKVFYMPYQVSVIEESTFLDCRSLEYVKYHDSNGDEVVGNNSITRIEDHAFTSCISLKTFSAPKNLVYLGESCFQKCPLITNFFFPKTKKSGSTITNKITVRSYAFADCSMLLSVYFETNMEEIDDYAFVNCDPQLTVRYTGTSIPNYYKNGVKQSHWRDTNIASDLKGLVNVLTKQANIDSGPEYPSLYYSISSSSQKLDSAAGDSHCQIDVITSAEAAADGQYAIISGFDTPMEDEGCYDTQSKTLTIPETIDGYPIRVIDYLAFANNEDIEHVVFSSNLVQIKHQAFYKCTNIYSLDFSACTSLEEVSYFCFQDGTFTNTKVTSISLPDCLEWVGDYAFANFVNVNDFHLSQGLRAIADLAFYGLGQNITAAEANVDILLPKTLNDADAQKAYFKHQKSPNGYSHTDYSRWYAIGKYSFNYANCVRTVTMQVDDVAAHAEPGNSYATSIFSNAFKDCSSLLRFKSNSNLKYLGKDAFKNCPVIKEIFLSTKKAEEATIDYPWCIDENNGNYGGTLFYGASPELVVYLDGDHAPGLLDSYSRTSDPTGDNAYQIGHMWNSESNDSYKNEIQGIYTDTGKHARYFQNRTNVPTYTGVNFATDIIYWNPETKLTVDAPTSPEGYDAGVISFVKTGTNEYTVARYYCVQGATSNDGSGYYKIDLTSVPGISTDSIHYLKHIGPEAFGKSSLSGENSNRKRAPGLYFILPESIETIDERAFYRRASGDGGCGKFGVRVITYKNSNGNYIAANGVDEITPSDFEDVTIKNIEKNGKNNVPDVDKRGFCVLPPNLTTIGKDAFYNHIFASVYIGANVTFIGHAAFYTQPNSETVSRSPLLTFTMESNSTFDVESSGIYYIGGGTNKKMLVSQANGNTGTLTIASDTKAIGLQACANTKYTTITIPSGLTTIYGSGFARNYSMTTFNTVSSVRYIGTMENPLYDPVNFPWQDDGYDEVWDSSVGVHFDNSDYREMAFSTREIIESQFGAFYNCTKLATIDFTTMTEIRKIGWAAFFNCKAMKNMSGSKNYIYKTYTGSNDAFTTLSISGRANNQGVIDLSGCSKLRSIDMDAFKDCNSVNFFHLPNTRGSASESQIYIGFDPESPRINDKNVVTPGQIFTNSKSIRVLIGETAEYACYDFGGKNHNSSAHYATNCFGTGNTLYYYVGSEFDVPDKSGSAIKYWTKYNHPTDGIVYVLMNNESDAKTFFKKGHVPAA